jgi:lipoic acid synthetase
MSAPLRARWLGAVPYSEALALQESLFANGTEQHLLLLTHPHVFTYGPNADLSRNLKCDPQEVGADLLAVNRGGDITYHGPGQLVAYPILNIGGKSNLANGPADSVAHVCKVEQVVIDTLAELGLPNAGRLDGFPGVWLDVDTPNPRKICAIGVRVSRGRSMHGLALNVNTDLAYMCDHIIPCGIGDRAVTSLHEEGIEVDMQKVVDTLVAVASRTWSDGMLERQDVAWKHRTEDLAPFSRGMGPGTRVLHRLGAAGVSESVAISERKPEWLRPKVVHGEEVMNLKRTIGDLGLVTVCEEAGCPNLSECWSQGTATLMVLGERCTRACGFCLVDTRKPALPEVDEPQRVAEAVMRMNLAHVVLTMVARDDLADDGMEHMARCVEAVRAVRPETRVETLISDCRGSSSLDVLIAVRPDVLNHNIETVPRLQRAVRPSAGYARSLSVLARSKKAGLVTKSGIIVGMGETDEEVYGVLADLAGIGVDIVTIGQYLRPTSNHLPVHRWVEPSVFDAYAALGHELGIAHVESSPLTRSSYHAREAAEAAEPVAVSIGSRS